LPAKSIEIIAENNHFILPIDLTIKDKFGRKVSERFEFLLDTGATKCVIPKETARAYGMEPMRDSGGTIVSETVTTANGLIPISVVKAESMSISGTELLVEEPIEMWMGNDFLLGMNFLLHFKLHIEY
jgi:clan AA aspartic protease (TIGR02281 family)